MKITIPRIVKNSGASPICVNTSILRRKVFAKVNVLPWR